jgi:hypothetical protein
MYFSSSRSPSILWLVFNSYILGLDCLWFNPNGFTFGRFNFKESKLILSGMISRVHSNLKLGFVVFAYKHRSFCLKLTSLLTKINSIKIIFCHHWITHTLTKSFFLRLFLMLFGFMHRIVINCLHGSCKCLFEPEWKGFDFECSIYMVCTILCLHKRFVNKLC